MGAMTMWFGSEDPTRAQVVKTVMALGIMVLVLFGALSEFVPHPLLTGHDAAIAFLGLGVAETVAMLVYAFRHGTLGAMGSGLKLILIVLGMPFFLALMSWLAVKGLGSAATRAVGSDITLEAAMRTEYSRSRRSCDYRLRGAPIEHSIPNHLCISEKTYARHPDADVAVILAGRRTWLGIQIDTIRVR